MGLGRGGTGKGHIVVDDAVSLYLQYSLMLIFVMLGSNLFYFVLLLVDAFEMVYDPKTIGLKEPARGNKGDLKADAIHPE